LEPTERRSSTSVPIRQPDTSSRKIWSSACAPAATAVPDRATRTGRREGNDMPVRKELYIDGEWISPESGEYLEVVNPRTEEVSGQAPAAAAADVDAAIAAANRAFDGAWSQRAFDERAEVIERAATLLGERADEIGETMFAEQGTPPQ